MTTTNYPEDDTNEYELEEGITASTFFLILTIMILSVVLLISQSGGI